MTAVDETTMKEEDLEEAVGLLTQLEVGHDPKFTSSSYDASCTPTLA